MDIFQIVANIWLSRWSLVQAIRDLSSLLFCFLGFKKGAPYIFTKLVKPLESHWRAQGFPMAIFFDDRVGAGPLLQDAKLNSHWFVQIFPVADLK